MQRAAYADENSRIVQASQACEQHLRQLLGLSESLNIDDQELIENCLQTVSVLSELKTRAFGSGENTSGPFDQGLQTLAANIRQVMLLRLPEIEGR